MVYDSKKTRDVTLEDIEYHEKKLNMVFPDALKTLYLGDIERNWKKLKMPYSDELHALYDEVQDNEDTRWKINIKERELTYTKTLVFKDSNGELRKFNGFFSLFDDKKDIQQQYKQARYDEPPYLIPFAESFGDHIAIHRETKQIFLFRITIVARNDTWSPEEYYQANSVLVAESFAEFLASIAWVEGIPCFGDRGQITSFLNGESLWKKAVSLRLQPHIPLVLASCAQSISEHEIEQLEKQLSVSFPKELKDFYAQYNGGYPNKEYWIDPKGIYGDLHISHDFFLPLLYRNCQDEDEDRYEETMESLAQLLWSQGFLPKDILPVFFSESWSRHWEGKSVKVTIELYCISQKEGKMYLYSSPYIPYACKEDILSIRESKEPIPFTYTRDLASSFEEYLEHFTNDGREFSSLADIDSSRIVE